MWLVLEKADGRSFSFADARVGTAWFVLQFSGNTDAFTERRIAKFRRPTGMTFATAKE